MATDPPESVTPLTLGASAVATDVDLLLDGDARTIGAKASDTVWFVSWRGRAKIPGDTAKVPPEAMPPPGRLDLLGTGGFVLRSDTIFDPLLSGRWTPAIGRRGASTRSYDHTLAMPETMLAFSESLFGTAAAFSEVSGSGSTNGRNLKGSVVARGLYFAGARPLKLTLTFKYRGKRFAVGTEPGPVPPIPPVAVVVAPALAETGNGGQVAFAADVEGAAGGVTWELRGPGTIDANGLYTAPASGIVRTQVIARSVNDPAAVGLAAVDVGP